MRIIVWGINYAPEQTGIAPYNTGLCEHLAQAGHDTRMLTTFSYYPEWRKAEDDRRRIYRTDTIEAVRVHRCWHYVPARPDALRRMIHEATFVLASFVRFLTLPRCDVAVVVSPPLLLGAAAWIACALRRSRYVFHVQDMQPDAAVMLGLLKPGKLTRLLYFLERLAHRRASAVSGITPGMLSLFSAKGVPADRQVLFPNWMPDLDGENSPRGVFRHTHGISEDAFLAVYSGNLGKKQGLGAILDAAKLVRRASPGPATASSRPIVFVIAGDGVEKPALAGRIEREGLTNVRLLPLLPKERYRELLIDADVCLVTQQPGSGSLFFPSKLLTILAHGRPVVAVADPGGELEQSIIEGGFGWSAIPGNAASFARALDEAASNPAECDRRGECGAGWVRPFARGRVLADFERELLLRFGEETRKISSKPPSQR
ncbi:MAG: WcaI family glycosyltransferase [Opitutaceae bacterium]